MEKYVETLSNAIISLGQPSWLDYIQVIASIISIVISAWAVVMAVMIPRKIAYKQDKIALFDKRFAAYNVFQKYEAFSGQIKQEEDVENYKKSFVMIFYEGESVKFEGRNALLKIQQVSMPLQHMTFLYENITDDELEEILASLCDFIIALVINAGVEECKNRYVNAIETFGSKHTKYICSLLKTEC